MAVVVAIGAGFALVVVGGMDGKPTYDEIRAGDEGWWVGYADRDRVHDVAVGRDGEVWVATAGGVAKRHPQGWEVHTIEHGLPHQSVHAIEVTDGEVWVGTSDGIAVYDKDAWLHHDQEDALADEVVRALDVSPDGALWAASTAGLTTYDGQDWTRHDQGAWDLTITADGALWTVTQHHQGRGAVRVLEDGQWTVHDGHTDAGPLHDRYDLPYAVNAEAGGDQVWVGTRRGVSRFDEDRWHRIGLEGTAGVPLPEVTALVPADDGVWVATSARGVWRLTDGSWTDASDGLPGSPDDEVQPRQPVTALAIDDDGGLWAGLGRSGIAQADTDVDPPDAERALPDAWRVERLSAGLPAHVDARSVLTDNGTVWIGTLDDGVWRHEDDAEERARDTWNSYGVDDGLPSNQVHTLAGTDDGEVWAGTDTGLARFDGKGWSPVGPDGPADAVVHHLAPAGDALWAATDDGLWYHTEGTWTQHTTAEGLPTDEVVAVALADNGRVWAGTDAGLAVLDQADGWQQPSHEAGLAQARITSVAVTDTSVWAATYDPATHDSAVVVLNPDDATTVSFTEDDGFVGPIGGLFVDARGAVWAADDRGPSRYRDGRWTHYLTPSRTGPTRAAAKDEHGDLWVATRHGVGRILVPR